MAWKWLWETETKYYDGDITRDTDWGGDASTGNLPVSGGALQKWLKNEINARVGYMVRSAEKEDDGLFHVRGFTSEEDYNEWLADKEDNADLVLTHFTIPDMSSTTASYVLNLVSGSPAYVVSTDGNVVLKLRFVSVMYSPIDQSTTDTGEAGVLTIQTKAASASAWTTKGTVSINSLPKDSTEYTDVDISRYLSNGEQQVRVIVKGETSEASTNYVTMTVVKTTLSLTFANDWQNPIRNAAITPSYYINGAVEKTLNMVVDGVRTVTAYIGETTYIDTPYSKTTLTDGSDEANPVCTQGVHTIEAWLSVDKNGVQVESTHVTSQVLVVLDETNAEPDVMLNDMAAKLVNWTEQTIFRYAVYNPEGTSLPLTFNLYDFNRTTLYASYPMGNVEEGVQYDFTNMVEIEETLESFPVRLDIMSGDTLMKSLVLEVDNSQSFSPTEGADFIFNPKLRTNQEENPATVVNAVTGEEVASTFEGFAFLNDAYTTDDEGNKCFRVLAGDKLHITGYEAFSGFMGSSHTASLTMEFDFAVRNITDEDEPILQMCSYNNGIPVGWEMKPLEAMFGTLGLQVRLDQDVAWSEGVRTHVAVNIVYNLANSGLNYIRVFVNGIINREMSYLSTDTFVQYVDGVKTSGGIIIGASQAEIDIYSIRVYKKALSSSDVMQDRMAAFPTAAEKVAFRESNDILVDGYINYEKTKVKYNTLLWKPNARTEGTCRLATYGDKKKQLQYGDLDVNIVGDEAHSGTLYNVNTQGQGTSSMSYWKWNQRFQFDDDGYFVNLSGTRHEGVWQLEDGMPFSSRNDAKLNWASSMQSHKMGATALYHDCWKKIIGNNTITSTEGGESFTGTSGGYADCRVTVKQKEFMLFVQETESSEPVYYGNYTFGPGKGDKPTFGYDKKTFPDFTMLEGCDNNKALVMHRVPWDSHIGGSLDDEVWTYNDEDNWELSMGSGNLWEEFKDTFNFVYLHHMDIHPYVGTLAQLKADTTVSQEQDYWVTVGSSDAAQYDLFRYDVVDKAWVAAGLERATLNVNTQCGNIASGVDWDATNDKFIAKRMEMFKASVGSHYHLQDVFFTMQFLLLLAASDNWGKNTYLYKAVAGDKIMYFQDDLDSIKPTDNVGRKTKPYYLEEHDLKSDGQPYWNSSRNAFYNLIKACYPDELRAMMNSILTAMSELGGGSLDGCLQKYFYYIQETFPAVSYNEVARLLYEDAAKALADGRYTTNTPPLPQCLGDQLQSEKEWDKKRMVYLSSYASYGEFAGGEVSGALAFRSILTTTGASPKYKFTVVPHIWLYPANGTGDSVFPTHTRVQAGEPFTFPERASDGNTNVRINGINYYRQIGEFGDKSVGEAFALSGERLTQFVAASDAPEFRITSMTVAARNLELLDLTGIATLGGALNLSAINRLKAIKLSGTSVTSVTLPETDALTTLELPATLTSLRIGNQPGLVSVSVDGTDSLQTLYIDHTKAKNFDSKAIVTMLYNSAQKSGISPSEVTLLGVDWTDMPVAVMEWLTDSIPVLTLTGKISIKEDGAGGIPRVTWAIKNKLIGKFGDIDTGSGDLTVTYTKRVFDQTQAKVKGMFYNEAGSTFPFEVNPGDYYSNTVTGIDWSLSGLTDTKASIDGRTGVLTVVSLSDTEDTAIVTATVHLYEGGEAKTVVLTKEIEIWDRPAQLGDLVYYDGTYSSVDAYEGVKTPIGVCFYVAPRNADGSVNETYNRAADKQLRLMVALRDVTASGANSSFTSWQWGAYPINSDTAHQDSYSLFDTKEDGTRVNLTHAELTSIYDIPTIVNLGSSGLASGYLDTSADANSDFRDVTQEETVINDGFKLVTASYAIGDGFGYGETVTQVTARTLTAELAALAGSGYAEGDIVNSGYAKTLKIIAHRNKVLQGDIIGADGEVFIPANTFAKPDATGGDELGSLALMIEAIRAWAADENGLGDANPNKWSQLYWPFISACHAYQPTNLKAGEVLADRFKAHNWFAPTDGQLARICWYTKYGSLAESEGRGTDIFAKAKSKGLLSFSTSSYHWSVTEPSSGNSWYVTFGNGYTYGLYKYYSDVGRAVSAF